MPPNWNLFGSSTVARRCLGLQWKRWMALSDAVAEESWSKVRQTVGRWRSAEVSTGVPLSRAASAEDWSGYESDDERDFFRLLTLRRLIAVKVAFALYAQDH